MAVVLLPAVSFGQEPAPPPKPYANRPVQREPDTVRAARIAAEGNQAAARINANQADLNAKLQANVSWWQIVGGFFVAVAAFVAAMVNWQNVRATRKKIDEDGKNAQNQLKQAKEHYEASQLTSAIESDRKRLEDRFIDAQNRLAKRGSDHEAVSAINRLIEIAQTLNPGISHRTDEQAVSLFGLPKGWSIKLSGDQKHRPTENAFPYFKHVARTLASIVLLEPSQAARDAAVRGIGRMARFCVREAEGMVWDDFETLPQGIVPMPLTKFLAETLAEATLDAEARWLAAWGGYTKAIERLDSPFNGKDWDADSDEVVEFPNEPSAGRADAAEFAQASRKDRMIRLFPAFEYERHEVPNPKTGEIDQVFWPVWSPDMDLWGIVRVLCPFISGNEALLTDFLLDAAESDAAKRAATIQEHSGADDKNNLRSEARQRLDEAARQAMSSRDGLAAILREVHLDDLQLPSEFRGSEEHQWDGERASKVERSLDEFFPEPGSTRKIVFLRKMHIDLSQAWLVGADLKNADLSGVQLYKANLTGADLSLAVLNGTAMYGASLWGAVLIQARGVGTHLVGANLNGVDLMSARLPAAFVSSATFIEAELMSAQLPGANMNAANFTGAALHYASFPHAKTSGIKLRGAVVSEMMFKWMSSPASEIEKQCYVARDGGNTIHYPPGVKDKRLKAWPRDGNERHIF